MCRRRMMRSVWQQSEWLGGGGCVLADCQLSKPMVVLCRCRLDEELYRLRGYISRSDTGGFQRIGISKLILIENSGRKKKKKKNTVAVCVHYHASPSSDIPHSARHLGDKRKLGCHFSTTTTTKKAVCFFVTQVSGTTAAINSTAIWLSAIGMHA
ncbi:hypothetical protein LY78DRAFT_182473 [Colletotrichum sublineola]|nr:hypothetical protein LY78DRAFT_182473 [Colletotrichum sublineola]